jgi:hypothetical protein
VRVRRPARHVSVRPMRRDNSWTRWPLSVNGAAIALLGAAYLGVEFVLPRLLAAADQAQGVGLFDPTRGGDPLLVRPHHVVRTLVSLWFIFSGTAHVSAAALYRRSTKGVVTALAVLGALSLVPTSVAFAILTLVALNRPTTPGSSQDGNPSTASAGSF